MWYNNPPSEHARYLRFCAQAGQAQIDHHNSELATGRKPTRAWSLNDLEARVRANRRLLATVILLEASTEARAGDVDVMGLNNPLLPEALEKRLVAAIHAKADPIDIDLLAYRPRLTPDKITVAILDGGDDSGTGINWCEIRSRVDPDDGSFLVYSLNGFWFGKFEPALNQVTIDGFDEPSPASELWRGHAPFHNHERDRATAWIREEVNAGRGVTAPFSKMLAKEVDDVPSPT